MKYLCAFPYFGGKTSMLRHVLPLLPPCHHYVEPFAGSAAVLLNRAPSPLETLNDINADIVNFFQVVREQHHELVHALRYTPYARAEYWAAHQDASDDLPPVERARRFFVRSIQGWGGLGAGGRYLTSWSYHIQHSRNGVAQCVSHWLGHIDALPQIAARLRTVQIECRDALELIAAYDSPGTLFYIDPPYPADTREAKSHCIYAAELSDQGHRDLASLLRTVRGKVLLSTYDCALMRELYSDDHWLWLEGPLRAVRASQHRTKPKKREWFVLNYKPPQSVLPLP